MKLAAEKTAIIFPLLSAVFLLCFGAPIQAAADDSGASVAASGKEVASLNDGGGEPGKAYRAFIDAVYRKDQAAICKIVASAADFDRCITEKHQVDMYGMLFGQPQRHEVTGGVLKGDEATLNVNYYWPVGQKSTGTVVMKRTDGRWVLGSMAASASTDVNIQAAGTADLGSPKGESFFGPIAISANRVQNAGKCPIAVTFTATINFKQPLPKGFTFTYHWEHSDGKKTGTHTVSPPRRQRSMSIKEVWEVGAPGGEHGVNARLVLDSGQVHLEKESPVIDISCR